MSQIRIGVVISTTRENRFADKPTQWLLKQIESYPELIAELLDLRAFPIGHLCASPSATASSIAGSVAVLGGQTSSSGSNQGIAGTQSA